MPLDTAVLCGVMSGTSLDGVTAAVARFTARDRRGFAVELLSFETIEYTDAERERLGGAMHGASAAEYNALSFHLGARFAEAAATAINAAGIPRADIAAIASHGQTVWHQPPAGTWQLGEGAVIAERTKLPVIEDFRVADVAAGGQGAPLVPIADALLFGNNDAARALHNIGGISNLTVVPRLGDTAGVRAFDTGPGVAVIDAVTHALVGNRFDPDGSFASTGSPIETVIEAQLANPYFAMDPPKSTGRELFGDTYAIALIDACHAASPDAHDGDVIATATEITARTVADAYARFVPEPIADIVVSGGGAKNAFLIQRIKHHLAARDLAVDVRQFDELFFPGEAKEAVAFAFLGFLHLRGEPGNIPTSTGARGPRVLGKLLPAVSQ